MEAKPGFAPGFAGWDDFGLASRAPLRGSSVSFGIREPLESTLRQARRLSGYSWLLGAGAGRKDVASIG